MRRLLKNHSRPQRPRSFWSAPRIATSSPVPELSFLPAPYRGGRAKEESRITCMRMLRMRPFFPPNRQSRSQSFVPLDQRSENVSSGSNHYERTKEITEFWLSGSLRICIYGACLKWLLPELSFSDRWSRGTKLWERDCQIGGKTIFGSIFQIWLVARFSE